VVAFSIAFNQNHELLGKNGLLPANKYMEKFYNHIINNENRKSENELTKAYNLFVNCPSLFWFFDWSKNIDWLLWLCSLTGI